MSLTKSVFLTDSTSVRKYIKSETSRFRTFVANRVSEILKYLSHFKGGMQTQLAILQMRPPEG